MCSWQQAYISVGNCGIHLKQRLHKLCMEIVLICSWDQLR
jgi:hypothetical protein